MADGDSTRSGRTCTGCHEFKPWDSFCKASRGHMGRNSRCRACMALYARLHKDRINELSLARYHRLQEPKRLAKEHARRAKIESPVKRCSRCKKIKPKSDFGPDRTRLDGLRAYCRECKVDESRSYRGRYPDRQARASANWAKNHPEQRAKSRRKLQGRPVYRVMHSISTRIYLLLKGKKSARTEKIVGYSAKELMDHLERQFLAGMSWENYGEWHIDHIRPLKSFTDASDESIRQAWALTNLRPLWAKDNLKKNAKITHLI